MAIRVRNPTLATVEDTARFLEILLDEYPRLQNEWQERMEAEFENEARECAEGDTEIYLSMISQSNNLLDFVYPTKNLFYKAVAIMTFSLFETTISKLANETPVKLKKNKKKNEEECSPIINHICNQYNFELSPEAQEAKSQICDLFRILRNNLVHNDSKAINNIDKMKELCGRWHEVSMRDNDIFIDGPNFIREMIRKERFILEELCAGMGLAHTTSSNGTSNKL